MIEISDALASVLTRSYVYAIRVESWLGGELLSDNVPIADGSETSDRSMRVPERITLTVPRLDRGTSWAPGVDVRHPLAANGQRLRVLLGVGVGGASIEWLQRGWFVVHEARVSGDSVNVDARGMLSLIDEARLVAPYQPAGGLMATVRGLVEPALTVNYAATLTDRSVPSGINFDEDRLGAVWEVLDAWPADAAVSPEGVLEVAPPVTTADTAVWSLTDGLGGTIVRTAGVSTREEAFNTVVARGTASDGAQVQGSATIVTGPKSAAGDFNPLPVPFFFSSPLLTTTAQARTAAQTVLDRKLRTASTMLEIECVPQPALLPGDVISLTSELHSGSVIIEAMRLPYVAGGGSMELTVRVPT